MKTSTIETLRSAYGRATVAAEDASRALYRAEQQGSRTVGLCRHREAAANDRLNAAEKAYRAATVTT